VIGLRVGLEKNMQMVYTIKKLNSVLFQNNYSSRFISLFYTEMEKNGNLFYINAGHPSPLLIIGNEISELESTGLLLGALPEIALRRSYISIPPKGVLVLYTDGILERDNKKGEEFGAARLKKLILQNKEKSAEEIMNSIFSAADDFGKSKKWKDDATVVVVKRIE
jgi:sigma-B regulation protein RsbU (phosphoserine phosphatase)